MATAVLPPGPKGKPLVGVFPQFRRDPPAFLLKVTREYGDVAYFKLGKQNMYFLNTPEAVQDVLVTHSGKFMKSPLIQRAKVLLGEGLLTSESRFHLRQRRLAQPAFHRQRIAGYAASMVECVHRISSEWKDGETRDISEDMMRLTLAVVAKTLFNADVGKEADEIGQALTDVLGLFNMLILPFTDLMRKLPLPSVRRFQRARAFLDKTIYRIIDERRETGIDHGDLLSMLLLAQDEQGDGGSMTDTQVRDEALTLFLAGHETTANALTWTWYLLSQNPEPEARLRRELQSVLAGRAPAFDDLPNLPYTEMVFAESMRLYPPAWGLSRLVMEDYSAGGYDIPKGSIVLMSPYVMHRNPKYFPDPESFTPERWTPEFKETRPKFSYFPFGGGPRVCIGERFAWTEGILVLATIAQTWRLQLDPTQQVAHRAQITLRARHGMRMKLSPAPIQENRCAAGKRYTERQPD